MRWQAACAAVLSASLAAAPCLAEAPPDGSHSLAPMTVAGPPSLYAVPPSATPEGSSDAAGRGFAESTGGAGGIRIGRGSSAAASTPAPVAPATGAGTQYAASGAPVPAPAAAAKANAEGGGDGTDQNALMIGTAGALAGAALGFVLGGPIGAAAGFLGGLFIGAMIGKAKSNKGG